MINHKLLRKCAEALYKDLDDNTEFLETTEGDIVECISKENIEGIISGLLVTLATVVGHYGAEDILEFKDKFENVIKENIEN